MAAGIETMRNETKPCVKRNEPKQKPLAKRRETNDVPKRKGAVVFACACALAFGFAFAFTFTFTFTLTLHTHIYRSHTHTSIISMFLQEARGRNRLERLHVAHLTSNLHSKT